MPMPPARWVAACEPDGTHSILDLDAACDEHVFAAGLTEAEAIAVLRDLDEVA